MPCIIFYWKAADYYYSHVKYFRTIGCVKTISYVLNGAMINAYIIIFVNPLCLS